MQWYPVGPSFVFGPRDPSFKRLSRRNERGEQGMVQFIAVDPTDPATIYTLDRPFWGGRAAFRTRDGGASWTSILDALLENDVYVAPNCLAINPAHPETLYLGTGWNEGQWRSFGIYVSHDRGETWQKLGFNIAANVNQILVDPRSAGGLASTVLVAAIMAQGTLFGLDMMACSRGLDLLVQTPGVDPTRMGIYGLSQGGQTALYLPAMDPRISASVCSAYFNQRFSKLVGPTRSMSYLDSNEEDKFFSEVISWFSDSDLVSLIAPRAFAVEAGLHDGSVDFDRSREEFSNARVHHDKLGRSDRIEYIPHAQGHVSATRRAMEFLVEHLQP